MIVKINLKNSIFFENIKQSIINQIETSENNQANYMIVKTKPIKVGTDGLADIGFEIKGSIISAQTIVLNDEDIDINGNIKNGIPLVVDEILPLLVGPSQVKVEYSPNLYLLLTVLVGDT
jgi:hypothetical protein